MRAASPLPGILAEIEEIAGRDAAIALALALGGESLYVPRPNNVCPGHRLVDAVGVAAARAIAAHHQGETIDVPLARRALARHLAETGARPSEIARRLGISIKTARRYRS